MRKRLAGWAGILAAALLMLPLSACDEILDVGNPSEIPVDDLADEALLDAQVAGVIARFMENIAGDEEGIVQGASFMTDEQVTGLNWEDWQRENQRIVEYNEGAVDVIWSNQSEIVRLGEDALAQLDSLSANPTQDDRVAQVSVLTGYGYLFLGEHFCHAVFSTPDSLSADVKTPNEVFQLAIPHFERAIAVGTAAGASDLVNLAHVGLARTYLNLENFTQTIQYAQAVSPGFVYWVEYSDVDTDVDNNLHNEVTGSNHTIGVHPLFLNGTYGDNGLVAGQTDPRIQHTSDWDDGHDGSTKLYKPFQGRRYSGYTGATIASGAVEGTDVILFQPETDVMLADDVEAQHHMFEAMYRDGQPEGPILAFVNARRAVGNEAPASFAGADLFAELRRQRALDHYMGGLRLGDLRRWKRQGVGDFFPTGATPNPERPPGVYGEWTCYPMPIEEYEGNPNLDKPADPFTPPGI